MTDQPQTIEEILKARLAVTQEISAVTAEQLRLMQLIGGMSVLEMGGKDPERVGEEMARHRAALARCEEEIAALEGRMAALDGRLERRIEGGET
ncbi:hypothetical protein M4578_21040 [Salipiger sp. P9]|uniref:hypothetical protein n=1 Tax=Salipiger pentaromativorans TaxID=2943193 RepID=UPI002156FFBF|nr:hypothetical protein [Salipiger pentaromativorans]MCR8550315.1 hypothetical protein [Salipiger pentaromativorans]